MNCKNWKGAIKLGVIDKCEFTIESQADWFFNGKNRFAYIKYCPFCGNKLNKERGCTNENYIYRNLEKFEKYFFAKDFYIPMDFINLPSVGSENVLYYIQNAENLFCWDKKDNLYKVLLLDNHILEKKDFFEILQNYLNKEKYKITFLENGFYLKWIKGEN